MNNKLFVGSLPFATSEDELKEFFSVAGEVTSSKIITDKFTGRSRGFGFVEMSSEEGAQKAIEMLDGKTLGEREITVSLARPMAERA
ncbi:RNA-binding protein [Patescibacteria group bacterium]|nr:RNA-binding protein [Patescibacteria group bacterium]MBU1705353.1 RNA-binding protein [Patescibacteria group bacterium]